MWRGSDQDRASLQAACVPLWPSQHAEYHIPTKEYVKRNPGAAGGGALARPAGYWRQARATIKERLKRRHAWPLPPPAAAGVQLAGREAAALTGCDAFVVSGKLSPAGDHRQVITGRSRPWAGGGIEWR